MQGLNIEQRRLEGTKTLSADLAQHILRRYYDGKIAVITDRPNVLISSVRKQWLRLIRQKARERSSTLNPRKSELDWELLRLQGVIFTAQLPIYDSHANVCFATIEQFLQAPPVSRTLYITHDIERHELYTVAAWMPAPGLVVIYDWQ
jgi:hypothetical protein